MTIHVDDLEIAGGHAVVQELLKILEQEFGELTIQRGGVHQLWCAAHPEPHHT